MKSRLEPENLNFIVEMIQTFSISFILVHSTSFFPFYLSFTYSVLSDETSPESLMTGGNLAKFPLSSGAQGQPAPSHHPMTGFLVQPVLPDN